MLPKIIMKKKIPNQNQKTKNEIKPKKGASLDNKEKIVHKSEIKRE